MSRFTPLTLEQLEQNINQLETNYHEKKTVDNPIRDVQISLLKAVLEDIKSIDLTSPENQKRIQATTENHQLTKQIILTGALFFLAKQVEREYTGSVTRHLAFLSSRFSAESSVLFNELRPAVGLSVENKMDEEDFDAYVNAFRFFIADRVEAAGNPYASIEGLNTRLLQKDIKQICELQSISDRELYQAQRALAPKPAIEEQLPKDYAYRNLRSLIRVVDLNAKPEFYDESTASRITSKLADAEAKAAAKVQFMEVDAVRGYRHAFADDPDALARIDEFEANRASRSQLHNQIHQVVERTEAGADPRELREKTVPLTTSVMENARASFFGGLKHEVESFDKSNLKAPKESAGGPALS